MNDPSLTRGVGTSDNLSGVQSDNSEPSCFAYNEWYLTLRVENLHILCDRNVSCIQYQITTSDKHLEITK
jgi:hypothetical protein